MGQDDDFASGDKFFIESQEVGAEHGCTVQGCVRATACGETVKCTRLELERQIWREDDVHPAEKLAQFRRRERSIKVNVAVQGRHVQIRLCKAARHMEVDVFPHWNQLSSGLDEQVIPLVPTV